MGILYSIFYFLVLISACASSQVDENKNIFKNSSEAGFLSKSSSWMQSPEEVILEQIDFEKYSRILNVTNTTDSPKWIDTKKTSAAQAYICIATLIIYGVLLILSWQKDKKESKEESELITKKKGTPIKLEVTKKYIDNTKEFRSFSIIFEDKNKLLGEKIFDLEDTERENNQEIDENKESETSYERKIENMPNNFNIKVTQPDIKENNKEMIYEHRSIEEKSDENLNNLRNKALTEENSNNKNQNEMNEDMEGNASLSFLAPDEVYIYKQEKKKDEKLTYSLFLTKKTADNTKTSWKEKVKKYHSLLSIFYFKSPRRTRLLFVTLYTLVLIGQMFFIGLFYMNDHTSTVKTVKDSDPSDKKKHPKTLAYEAEDFFIMLFCVFAMLIIMIIIDLICLEREIKENMSAAYSNNIRKTNLKWRIAGLVTCWGLIGLFCWVIIELCNNYEKSISMVWLTSTLISYVIKICIFSFFENDLITWLASLPEKLRKYYERKHQMEDQEIDDNNEAVKDKNKNNEQVQEIE